jgi:hypothetical protein
MHECPICHQTYCLEPHDPETQRSWSDLKQKLLQIGGERVIWLNHEPHLDDLLARGQLLHDPVKIRKGQPNSCHENSAKLWAKDAVRTQICVGYGLNDGIWRQHTWASRDGSLLETTVKREHYFGIVLSDVEALSLWSRLHANPLDLADAWHKLFTRFPHLFPAFEAMGRRAALDFSAKLAQAGAQEGELADACPKLLARFASHLRPVVEQLQVKLAHDRTRDSVRKCRTA